MQDRAIIVGNWKMHKTQEEAIIFITKLLPALKGLAKKVLLAVPFTLIQIAADLSRGSQLKIGAQNMHDALEGPYTGEVGARMIKEAGAEFVILGHSERRWGLGETSGFVNRKVKRALEEKIRPIVCVGETQEERKKGQAEEAVEMQLAESLDGISDADQLMIAYEPVWAIGTGLTATPDQAQAMHYHCKGFLAKNLGKEGRKVPVLYGGSVKPELMRDLMKQPDIDGVLAGGVSLSVESFTQLINYQR